MMRITGRWVAAAGVAALLAGGIAACGGGAASYDRDTFCAAWADLAEGSELSAEQASSVVRRLPSLGPPAIKADLQLWADYFEKVIPLSTELSKDGAGLGAERRDELTRQIDELSAPMEPVMARIRATAESECSAGGTTTTAAADQAAAGPGGGNPLCAGAVEVTRWDLSGREVIVSASSSAFCLSEEREGRLVDVDAMRIRERPTSVDAPMWLAAGSSSTFGTTYLIVVPEGFPAFTVRTSTGTTLPSARTTTNLVLIYDPDAPRIGSGPSASQFRTTPVTLELVGTDGTVLARVSTPTPPTTTSTTSR